MIRRHLALGIGTATGILVATACTGSEPDLVATSDAGTAMDAPAADAGTTADAAVTVDPNDVHAECPRPSVSHPCGPDVNLDAAALHLDACKLGAKEQYLGEWVTPKNQQLTTAPSGGALYCRAAFEGRPGVVFEGSRGFVLGGAAASAIDYTDSFVVAAVLKYRQVGGTAGGIVFQRNSSDALSGFPGPQLTTNIAYSTELGGTNLVSTNGIGMQLRFGPKEGGAVAAATDDYREGPLVVITTLSAGKLELRLNGKSEKIVDVPSPLTTGSGEPLRIGHANSSNNAFEGVLGELAIFSSASGVDVLGIEGGLLAKWGVPKAQ